MPPQMQPMRPGWAVWNEHGDDTIPMNRSPDFSTRPQPPRASPGDLALLVVGIAAFVLAAGTAYRATAAARRAQATTAALRAELARGDGLVKKMEALRGDADENLASRVLLTLDAPPSRVLAELERHVPRDVHFSAMTLSYGPRLDIGLTVVARSGRAYDSMLERLIESGHFVDLRPGSEGRDGEIDARLSLTYQPFEIP